MKFFFIGLLWTTASVVSASDGHLKFQKPVFRLPAIRETATQEQTTSLSDIASKSKKKALFLSLLVPGLGELYLNNWQLREWQSGKYFFASEALLWSGHFYFKSASAWTKSDVKALAAAHAGVNWSTPKPADYYTVVGKFTDIYAYNEVQRRINGPSTVYEENADNYWQWDHIKNQRRYDDRRIEGKNYKRYSQFVIYGVVVNHVLSAINAVRMYNRAKKISGYQLRFDAVPSLGWAPYYVGTTVSKTF